MNPSRGTRLMRSGYRKRDITVRHTRADGTVLATNRYGPDVSISYPVGYYIEDYEFAAGIGDLDAYNGRFTITPDFPAGTYAYFVTIDSDGASAYPYSIGPSYFGVVATEDLGQSHITAPPGLVPYVPAPARRRTASH